MTNGYPSLNTPPTPDTSVKKPRRWVLVLSISVATLLGIGIGAAGGNTPAPAAEALPAVTVTSTQKVEVPTPAKTVEVKVPGPETTKTVEVANQVCQEALLRADKVIAISGEAFGLASEGFTAMSNLDVQEMERVNRELKKVQPKLQQALTAYQADRDTCYGSAT